MNAKRRGPAGVKADSGPPAYACNRWYVRVHLHTPQAGQIRRRASKGTPSRQTQSQNQRGCRQTQARRQDRENTPPVRSRSGNSGGYAPPRTVNGARNSASAKIAGAKPSRARPVARSALKNTGRHAEPSASEPLPVPCSKARRHRPVICPPSPRRETGPATWWTFRKTTD